MQMELERIKNQNLNQTISFKDAPLPVQLAMAAQQGLIDPRIAEYSVRVMINQLYPGLADQMAAEEAQQQEAAVQQQMMQSPNEVQSPEDFDQQIALAQMINGNNQPQSEPLTKPALDTIRQGLIPTM